MLERFARNTLYGVLAALSGSLGSFATTIVVARLLGVAETGVFNFALWVMSLATAATDLGAYASLARYLPELTRSGPSATAQRLAGYLLVPFATVTILGLLAFIVLAIYVDVDPATAARYEIGLHPSQWVIVGALYVAQAFSNFTVGYFQGSQRFDIAAKLAVYTAAVRLTATTIGCYWLGATGALLGYVVGLAISAPIPFAVSRYGGTLSPDLRRRVRRYSLFAWASTLASALIVARPEVAILNYFHGKEAVGLYSTAFTLANLAIQGPLLLTAGLVPYFSEHAGTGERPLLEKMMSSGTRLMAFMILPMAFGTAALAPELVPLLFGKAFGEAADPAVILIASSCLGGNSMLFAGLIIGMERSDFSFYLNLSGAALTLLIGFLLIPHLGTVGAAFGRALVQLYLFVLSAWFVLRRLSYPIPFAHLSRLLLAAIGCAVCARLILQVNPGIAGMVSAVCVAAAVYFLLVRLLRGLEHSDVDRLRSLLNSAPGVLRVPITAMFIHLASKPQT
ncbi:flippase [Methylobacterium nodulans]|uniref:Polysaccharide biosynthesis protein n=1 Tax=Methylobacterium nodulans (strain LMG 21967 / CNCM I-2342 / ORS 2060) TaxID=460265 RepID=B8IGJ3_METNO|nr:flippase [Methylobacterium nodulans]ACL55893.1 polysaccharide biosynthesis protein [Methylobacterium nodulans ORS 2060]